MIGAMAHETAPTAGRRSRPLVAWGAVLLVLGLLVGVVGGVVLVAQVGGDLVEVFTADAEATPLDQQLELREGTYIVYELTGSRTGPVTTPASQYLTVAVDDVTVTAPDGTEVPVTAPRFDETITRGTSTYTAAVSFDADDEGVYRISVTTPETQVLVAPGLSSIFTQSVAWLALLALGVIVFFVGVVLVVVGLVRTGGQRPAAEHQPVTAAVTVPAGWYADPHGVAAWRWWDGQSWTDQVG